MLARVSICTEVRMRWSMFVDRLSEHVAKAVMEEMYIMNGNKDFRKILNANLKPLSRELDPKKQCLVANSALTPSTGPPGIGDKDSWMISTDFR